jgi:thiol:disulfide interchange protein DsbD
VQAKLAGWTLLQADVTANSAADQALLQRFKLYGPPGIIFFDRQGREIDGIRVVGFQSADEFLGLLARLN